VRALEEGGIIAMKVVVNLEIMSPLPGLGD
jgi:hypothetical protein